MIVVINKTPPIPIRSFDYCAYEEGREESGPFGFGATKEEAIADLEYVTEALND